MPSYNYLLRKVYSYKQNDYMQTDFSNIENLTKALEKAESIGKMLGSDKDAAAKLILEKRPDLSPILSAVNLAKGDMSDVLKLFLSSQSGGNSSGGLSSLLPMLFGMNAKTQTATSQNVKSETPTNSVTPEKKGNYLSPIAFIASGDILKDILQILEK